MKYEDMMKEINKEYLRERNRLWQIKGRKCIYCGSVATELHHIVPRHVGGDNRLSNIVPLCYECHCKAHSKRPCRDGVKYGRKRTAKPINFDEVADYYLDGIYTLKTALEFTGLKRNTFYKFLHEFAENEDREYQIAERPFIQGSL